MSTGTHRKTREIPWGQIAGFFILFILTVMLLTGLSWLGTPAGAAGQARLPVLPAKVMLATLQRPVWDGRHPAVWTGPMPLCPAWVWRQAMDPNAGPGGRMFGFARTDKHGRVFLVECTPNGREFAWDAVVNGS
jgi:hypothetical protein